jgi:hypothetical protein
VTPPHGSVVVPPLDDELLVPPHVLPQMLATSPTHCASQPVVQQYESWAQMACAHGSQLDVSLPPEAQISWLQVLAPPPLLLVLLLELLVELELEELPLEPEPPWAAICC